MARNNQNIKNTPYYRHQGGCARTDEWSRVSIEPYINGFYVVDMKLPKVLSSSSYLQMDLISKIKPLAEKVQLINKYRKIQFSHYITQINNSDNDLSTINKEKAGLNDIFPGSSTDSQQLTISIQDDMDLKMSTIFEVWIDVLYYKLLGFSLIRKESYSLENYSTDIKLSVYKPNLRDLIVERTIKNVFPLTQPIAVSSNQNRSTSDLAEYQINCAYLMGM